MVGMVVGVITSLTPCLPELQPSLEGTALASSPSHSDLPITSLTTLGLTPPIFLKSSREQAGGAD